MKTYTVAVLGATGAVGQEMIKILQERNFPVGKLVPLASARSAGKTVRFRGEDVTIQEATETAFAGVDIVLGAAENDIAKKFAPDIVKSGAVFVDNSSAFRLDPKVPLIVPEVNPEDVKNHQGIISNPNCSTIITVTAVNALNAISPIRSMTASTYQAVSGAGLAAIKELRADTEANLKGEKFENVCFKKPISFNVIPQIDVFCDNGYTKEEMKVANETKKILHLPENTPISCTAARVPVFNGHSEAVDIEFEKEVTPEEVREILKNSFGVEVIDNPANFEYPTTRDASGKDPVYVGRIRKNLAFTNGISLWCVADNLRIGAALNTVRLCQKVIEMELY